MGGGGWARRLQAGGAAERDVSGGAGRAGAAGGRRGAVQLQPPPQDQVVQTLVQYNKIQYSANGERFYSSWRVGDTELERLWKCTNIPLVQYNARHG